MSPSPCLETQRGHRSALCPAKLTAVIIAKTWPGSNQGPCHPVRHPRATTDLILEGNQQQTNSLKHTSRECPLSLGVCFPKAQIALCTAFLIPPPPPPSLPPSHVAPAPLGLTGPASYQSPFMLRVTEQAGSCVFWGSGTKASKQQRKSLLIHGERWKQESKSGEEKPRVFSETCGKGLRTKRIKQKEGSSDPGSIHVVPQPGQTSLQGTGSHSLCCKGPSGDQHQEDAPSHRDPLLRVWNPFSPARHSGDI